MGNDFDHNNNSTNKPKITGFKKTTNRLRQGKGKKGIHRTCLDWADNLTEVCQPLSTSEILGYDIEILKSILVKSRTGSDLLSMAEELDLTICYDPQSPFSQFYPSETGGVITLNPTCSYGDLLNMFVCELRHAWQHKNGTLVNPMLFNPEEAILVNRAQHADVLMTAVKVAWELKLSEEEDAWHFLMASSKADIARIFELEATQDFRSLNNGRASRVAYDKFFENSHTKVSDRRIIHQMLLDDHGYMKTSDKTAIVDMTFFEKLGYLPSGANYLTSSSCEMPTDTKYSTVEDRSNANFLWFIKFERSFQEKELEMLQASVQKSAEIVDFSKWVAKSHKSAPSLKK